MKTEQIYQELKNISEKLGVSVFEKNFKDTGIKVKSGFCRVKDEDRFIIDKNKNFNKKVRILASFISTLNHEDIYVIPTVRETIEKHKSR
ncbi:MAG: hypothetical protein MUP22_02975 [Desulfobacterales bacterium]|nr:hypothetical protein [Desulfobacterales bacterium]